MKLLLLLLPCTTARCLHRTDYNATDNFCNKFQKELISEGKLLKLLQLNSTSGFCLQDATPPSSKWKFFPTQQSLCSPSPFPGACSPACSPASPGAPFSVNLFCSLNWEWIRSCSYWCLHFLLRLREISGTSGPPFPRKMPLIWSTSPRTTVFITDKWVSTG